MSFFRATQVNDINVYDSGLVKGEFLKFDVSEMFRIRERWVGGVCYKNYTGLDVNEFTLSKSIITRSIAKKIGTT